MRPPGGISPARGSPQHAASIRGGNIPARLPREESRTSRTGNPQDPLLANLETHRRARSQTAAGASSELRRSTNWGRGDGAAARALARPLAPRDWSGRREAPGSARLGPTGAGLRPPPSIRACGSPAHGSPTFFTARHSVSWRHGRLGRGAAIVPLRLIIRSGPVGRRMLVARSTMAVDGLPRSTAAGVVRQTISTRSSCICDTRPDTAAGGAARTCSSAPSAK